MLQARQRGVLLRGEADYQLHLIFLWYEQKPAQALEILEGLDARYPTNPLFQRRIAEVQDEYFHDRRASEAAWQTVIDRARAGRVYNPPRAESRAHIGRARLLERAGDRAARDRELSKCDAGGRRRCAHTQRSARRARPTRRVLIFFAPS